MSKFKGTKGEEKVWYQDDTDSYEITGNLSFVDEGKANAELFTDALLTAQQMGDEFMLPSEMWEQIKYLKELLSKERSANENKEIAIQHSIEKTITDIPVNKANFEHIAQTGKINGTLLNNLTRIFQEKDQQIAELREALKKVIEECKLSDNLRHAGYTIALKNSER